MFPKESSTTKRTELNLFAMLQGRYHQLMTSRGNIWRRPLSLHLWSSCHVKALRDSIFIIFPSLPCSDQKPLNKKVAKPYMSDIQKSDRLEQFLLMRLLKSSPLPFRKRLFGAGRHLCWYEVSTVKRFAALDLPSFEITKAIMSCTWIRLLSWTVVYQ